ncbi:hypothetical protein AB0395_43170 [Streptosporangium sp. NPDC051023]|uniref:hypothetical protein n=1 Tax=Streptosporangium sp. NPDC051023 TaxID=3155410 RepID=UPI00344EA97C
MTIDPMPAMASAQAGVEQKHVETAPEGRTYHGRHRLPSQPSHTPDMNAAAGTGGTSS